MKRMEWFSWFALGVVMLVRTVQAMETPTIDGPEIVATGRLAVYRLPEDLVTSPPQWLVIGPSDECFQVCDGGRTLCFASPVAGRYVLVAAAVRDNAVLLLRKDIQVGDQGPEPGPPPGPRPPEPRPPSWAEWAAAKAKESVTAEGLGDAKSVAAALRAVVKAIDEKKIVTPRFAREQVRAMVRANLRTVEAMRRWEAFSLALDAALDAEAAAGRLAKLDDYRRIWLEIAEGLERLSP
jgi:hypothetical protein